MNKNFIIVFCVCLLIGLIKVNGQSTCPFGINEKFNGVTNSYTSTGTPGWTNDTNFYVSPYQSIRGQYTAAGTIELTSPVVSTLGNTQVTLKFNHICKLSAVDAGIIEVNTGAGWVQLKNGPLPAPDNCVYTGSATTFTQSFGWKFSSLSYPVNWLPGQDSAMPNNNWWKQESFDISIIAANQASVQVRFKAAGNGMAGNYGWLIDDVEFCFSTCELDGSIISAVSPVISGSLGSPGPYTMCFNIFDSSGIAQADLSYAINGSSFNSIGGLQQITASLWCGSTYDTLHYGDTICWFVQTYDGSCNFNSTYYPAVGSICGYYYSGIPSIPFCDNFDFITSNWTAPTSSIDPYWESGQPGCGTTSDFITAPNSWFMKINDNGGFSFSFNSWLYSAAYNFSSAFNAKLSFWYASELSTASAIGVTLQYSFNNGITWNTLGGINDGCSKNWFNGTVATKPSWVGNSQGWKKASINLKCGTGINGSSGVRFKFLYNGFYGNSTNNGCFKIDNFCIELPPEKDMTVVSIISPRKKAATNFPLPVKVMIENAGNASQTSFNLITSLKPQGGSWAVVNSYPWSGTIYPGQRLNVMLPKIVLLAGSCDICVKVVLTGDAIVSNDQACVKIIGNTNPIAMNGNFENKLFWNADTLSIFNESADVAVDFMDDYNLINDEAIQIHSYPNPVKDLLFISFDQLLDQMYVSIKSISGQQVFSHAYFKEENLKIDVKRLSPGIYYLYCCQWEILFWQVA